MSNPIIILSAYLDMCDLPKLRVISVDLSTSDPLILGFDKEN
jgi:hypothetical protein